VSESPYARAAGLYDALYSFKDYAAEADRLHALIQERRPGARTLLDVACGTGKHLERLATRYAVEGVDLDPELLAVARERLPDVPLHEADMLELDIGHRFDAVTCLFSSIGYVKTDTNLRRAVAAMARHLEPDGVLVVEPWIAPDAFTPGYLDLTYVDQPDLKVARISVSAVIGALSVLHFNYLVGTADGVEHFTEDHELGLFTHEQYLGAFEAAGLRADYDADGLMGRGLYIGVS
jgi:SAM-dependent methyltransferase